MRRDRCDSRILVLYFPYNLRLSDGARPWKFLNHRSAGGPAARTSWRSQLVRPEEFVRSRRLGGNQGLAPSCICPPAYQAGAPWVASDGSRPSWISWRP